MNGIDYVLEFAEETIARWNWKDVAVLKVCMAAFGMMAGICVSKRNRRLAFGASFFVFLSTIAILIARVLDFEFPSYSSERELYEDENGFVMRISCEEDLEI